MSKRRFMVTDYLDQDFQPVSRSRSGRGAPQTTFAEQGSQLPIIHAPEPSPQTIVAQKPADPATTLKRGHLPAFVALFAFTLVLYARPSEFYPSPFTNSIALVLGIVTLAFFIPTQLSLEGNLTAPLREVNLALLFCLAGLLSIPLAINRLTAWEEFSGTFIRCIVIFIVMVNVTRTEARLKALLL